MNANLNLIWFEANLSLSNPTRDQTSERVQTIQLNESCTSYGEWGKSCENRKYWGFSTFLPISPNAGTTMWTNHLTPFYLCLGLSSQRLEYSILWFLLSPAFLSWQFSIKKYIHHNSVLILLLFSIAGFRQQSQSTDSAVWITKYCSQRESHHPKRGYNERWSS